MNTTAETYREILEGRPEVTKVLHCTSKNASVIVNILLVRDMDESETPFTNKRKDYSRSIGYTIDMLDNGYLTAKALEMLLVTDEQLLKKTYYQSKPLFALNSAHTRLRSALQRAAYLYLAAVDQLGSADRTAAIKKIYDQYTAAKNLDGLRALAAKCPDKSMLEIPAVVEFNKDGEWVSNYYMTSNDQEPFTNIELAESLIQMLNNSTKPFDVVINEFMSKRRTMTGPMGGTITIDSRDKVMKLLNFTTSSPKIQAAFTTATTEQQTKSLHRLVGYIGRRFPNRYLNWIVLSEGDLDTVKNQKSMYGYTDEQAIACEKTSIPVSITQANAPFSFQFRSKDKAVLIGSNKLEQDSATAEEERLLVLLNKPLEFTKELNRLEITLDGVHHLSNTEDIEPEKKVQPQKADRHVKFNADGQLKGTPLKPAPAKTTPVSSESSQKETRFESMRKTSAKKTDNLLREQTNAKETAKLKGLLEFKKAIPQIYFLYQRWVARTGCHIGKTTEINDIGRLVRIGMDDMHRFLPGNTNILGVLGDLEGLDDINLPFQNSTATSDLWSDLAELSALYTALLLVSELCGEIKGNPFAEDASWIPDTSRLHESSFHSEAKRVTDIKVAETKKK
jgi:hypothetical protein